MKQLRNLLISALVLIIAAPLTAQDTSTAPLSPEQIAAQMTPLHPKTLVLVFDITQSTRANGVFQNERAASATLIRTGCAIGDRIVLIKFGTDDKVVFDKTLTVNADKDALIDQIPPSVEPGHGTNIRQPHHDALKIINSGLPRPGVIVLLTDSFNDRPLTTDPTYQNYLKYYTLQSLTVYPDTPQNRGYERLLRKLLASGKLYQYGVGVGIAPDGRPIERLPLKPGEGDAGADTSTQTITVLKPEGTEKPQSNLPALLSGAAVGLLALLGICYWLFSRPLAIRLKLGDKGTPQDYRLRRGAKVGLGGPPLAVGPGDEVFPLAGLSAPVAFMQAAGGATLTPVPLSDGPKMFHNGLAMDGTVPIRVGDEIRILISATETAPPREHRIHVLDPHAAAF